MILIMITKVGSFKADHVDVVTPERLHAHCNAARIRKALRGREKLLGDSCLFPIIIWIDDLILLLVHCLLFCTTLPSLEGGQTGFLPQC